MSVIIVGGGMTGATLALAISHLTKGQLPVHLVEQVNKLARIKRELHQTLGREATDEELAEAGGAVGAPSPGLAIAGK